VVATTESKATGLTDPAHRIRSSKGQHPAPQSIAPCYCRASSTQAHFREHRHPHPPTPYPSPAAALRANFWAFLSCLWKQQKKLLSARTPQRALFWLTTLSTNAVAHTQNKRGVQTEPTRNRSRTERDEYSWQCFGCI